jgi:hypothetical protein
MVNTIKYIIIHIMVYTVVYSMIYTMVHIMHLWYISCTLKGPQQRPTKCCGPIRFSNTRTALFCRGYCTSRVPRVPQIAGAAGHSLQPSSRSNVVACSTSMQSGGTQSASHMDPQRVATYTEWNLVQQREYRH